MIKAQLVLTLTLCVGCFSAAHAQNYTPGKAVDRNFDSFARTFLDTHCIDCHGESDPEGALSLHELGPVDEVNAAVWKSVWAQVALGKCRRKTPARLRLPSGFSFQIGSFTS